MANKLAVYAYNVGFGDAILIEVPDGRKRRFILIDVGNATSGQGGEDQLLLDAVKDIQGITGGKIDLYVMTHEHMDHVQGLLYAKEKGVEIQIDTVWMTASSEPGYYERHPEAREKRLELERAAEAFSSMIGVSNLPTEFTTMLDLNTRSTKDCVDFIRRAGLKTHYVYRGYDLTGKHPFTDATTAFRILAPEEDTSVYYERVPHLALGANVPDTTMVDDSGRPLPLPGVDGSIFYELMDSMDNTFFGAVFAIDRAQNNTSLVFELSWRTRRLLFTGDAELKSWSKIAENNRLEPVDLFKIGHHGSRTALPPLPILNQILVPERKNQAVAVLTTCDGVYPGVPDPQSLATIKARTKNIYNTADVAVGKPQVISFGAKKK